MIAELGRRHDRSTFIVKRVLSPSELAWFELEYPEDVTVIEVCTKDTLVRRINVGGRSRTSTADFLDLGADIGIKCEVDL